MEHLLPGSHTSVMGGMVRGGVHHINESFLGLRVLLDLQHPHSHRRVLAAAAAAVFHHLRQGSVFGGMGTEL